MGCDLRQESMAPSPMHMHTCNGNHEEEPGYHFCEQCNYWWGNSSDPHGPRVVTDYRGRLEHPGPGAAPMGSWVLT